MAEKNELKKGASQFTLTGRFKKGKFSFALDTKSKKSNYFYSKLNCRVECGAGNIVFAEAMGGYSEDNRNFIRAWGIKEENGRKEDDYKLKFEIEWADRHNEEVLATVGNRKFLKVGVVKDDDGKVVVKKFLTEYDMIKYLSDNLEDEAPIEVRGNIKFSTYEGRIQIKKEIKSVFLTDKKEEEYKAEFTQTILVDKHSVEKPDKERQTVPISARVFDYDKETGGNIPYNLNLEFAYDDETVKQTAYMITKYMSPKEDITQITVTGNIVESVRLTEVKEEDMADDIKELIALGIIKKDAYIEKVVGKDKKENKFVIVSPIMRNITEETDGETLTKTEIAVDRRKFTEEDLIIPEKQEEKEVVVEATDDDLDDLLKDM